MGPTRGKMPRRCDYPADDRSEYRKRDAVSGVRHHAGLRHAEHEAARDEDPEEDGKRVQSGEEAHTKLRVSGIREADVQQGRDRGTANGEDRQGERRETVVFKRFPDRRSEASHPASPWTAVSPLARVGP